MTPERIRSLYWLCCLATFACFVVCSAEAFLIYPVIVRSRTLPTPCVSSAPMPAALPEPPLTVQASQPVVKSHHSVAVREGASSSGVRSRSVTQEGTSDTGIHSMKVEQTAVPAPKTESYEVRLLSAEEANQEAGDAALQKEDYKTAIDDYLRALGWNDKNAAVWNSLGEAYEKTNQLQDAIAAYKKAVGLNPNLVAAQNSLRRLQNTSSPK